MQILLQLDPCTTMKYHFSVNWLVVHGGHVKIQRFLCELRIVHEKEIMNWMHKLIVMVKKYIVVCANIAHGFVIYNCEN